MLQKRYTEQKITTYSTGNSPRKNFFKLVIFQVFSNIHVFSLHSSSSVYLFMATRCLFLLFVCCKAHNLL